MKRIRYILLLMISLLSGCSTFKPVSSETMNSFTRVGVVSLIGDRFTGNYQDLGFLSLGGVKAFECDLGSDSFNEEIEWQIIKNLDGRVPFELVALPELREVDHDINIFPGEPLIRTKMLSRLAKDKGCDGVIYIVPRHIVSGHPSGGPSYHYDELGIYFSNQKWQKEKISIFTHFLVHFIDSRKEKKVFTGFGLGFELTEKSYKDWPESCSELPSPDKDLFVESVKDLTINEAINEVNYRFFGEKSNQAR